MESRIKINETTLKHVNLIWCTTPHEVTEIYLGGRGFWELESEANV